MKCRRLPYLFCTLLLCSVSLRAQSPSPVIVGLTAGPSFGIVDGTAPFYSGSGDCGSFASGSFSSVRVEGEIVFPSFFSSRFGLSLRPVWRSSSVRFTGGGSSLWVYNADLDRAVAEEREFRLESETQTLGLGVLGTYRIGERFLFGLGPEIGYPLVQNTRQTEHILGPDDHAFPDGQSRRVMTEGPVYSATPLALGAVGFGGVTIPFGPGLSFQLGVVASADLLSPVREAEWRSFSFGGSAGIIYTFEKKKGIPPPSLPDVDEPVLPPPPLLHLSAAIEVFGLEGETRRDTITSRFREKEYCRSVRCVPQIFFDRGSADLPEVYGRTRADASFRPTFDSLALLDPFRLQQRILDLTALRLGYDTESTIVLHPAGGSPELGVRRCEQVREYLGAIWGVRPERVGIGDPLPKSRVAEMFDEGKEGVWMETSFPEITAPVVSRRLDRDFEAPVVKVATSHRADAGLRSWEVILASREKTIARYSSGGSNEGTGSMNWNMIYDEGQEESASVTALFSVEDSVGARADARSEAPLLMLRSRIAVAHYIEVEKMSETLFYRLSRAEASDISAARRKDSLGCRDILRELDGVLREGASVWIMEADAAPLYKSFPAFRDSLNDLLARRGLDAAGIAAPQELQETMKGMEDCLDPGGGSAWGIVVRQRIAR